MSRHVGAVAVYMWITTGFVIPRIEATVRSMRSRRAVNTSDHDIIGGDVTLSDEPNEVVVGLRGGGVADLNLFVAHRDHELEEPALARRVHRLSQGLVPVRAQVDGNPQRGLG